MRFSNTGYLSGNLLFALAFFLLALTPLQDFDTFWQLQSGKYMVETGSFIDRDVFSLAADVPRMEHCWLSDLIFYGLYSLGGYGLLGLIKPALIGLCAWLLFRWADPGPQGERGLVAAVTALCLLASEPSWLERPQLWTFLFSLLYLRLLYRGRTEGLRAWGWLPVLMVPWANLHAGCVFGFVLAGIFGAGELVRVLKGAASWRSLGQLAAVGLSLPLAASINPYGYHIPLILLGNISLHDVDLPSMAGVMEWLPPSWEQVPLFYVVMGFWGASLLPRVRRAEAGEWIFFAAFLYMGSSQIRHATLVPLLAGFFLAPAAVQLAGSGARSGWLDGLFRWATVVALVLVFIQQGRSGNLGLGLKKDFYPVAAADFVLEKQLPGNLYNAYDWGGYLMWRLYPSYRVFLDGRSTSQEHFMASTLIDEARPGWQGQLERYGVNTILTRTCYDDTGGPLPLIDALATDPGWALVHADAVGLVFVRRSLATAEPLPFAEVYRTQLAEAQRLYREDASRRRALLSQARALLKLGRAQPAREALGRFLDLEPTDRDGALLLSILGPDKGRS